MEASGASARRRKQRKPGQRPNIGATASMKSADSADTLGRRGVDGKEPEVKQEGLGLVGEDAGDIEDFAGDPSNQAGPDS